MEKVPFTSTISNKIRSLLRAKSPKILPGANANNKTIIPYHHKTPTCSWDSSTLEPLSARFLETDRGASASRVTALLVPGRTLQFHEASRRPDLKPAAIQNTLKETHARNIYSWVPTKPVEVQQPISIFGCPRMGMHLPGATRL
jgi:hypothetical protein